MEIEKLIDKKITDYKKQVADLENLKQSLNNPALNALFPDLKERAMERLGLVTESDKQFSSNLIKQTLIQAQQERRIGGPYAGLPHGGTGTPYGGSFTSRVQAIPDDEYRNHENRNHRGASAAVLRLLYTGPVAKKDLAGTLIWSQHLTNATVQQLKSRKLLQYTSNGDLILTETGRVQAEWLVKNPTAKLYQPNNGNGNKTENRGNDGNQ